MALYSSNLLAQKSRQPCKLSTSLRCNIASSTAQHGRRGSILRAAEVATVETAEPFIPERKYLDGEPEHVWRNGKPDYTVVNQAYLSGKTKNWVAGSLEAVVESVVKTLEMEISHKVSQLAGNTKTRHMTLSHYKAALSALTSTCQVLVAHSRSERAQQCCGGLAV